MLFAEFGISTDVDVDICSEAAYGHMVMSVKEGRVSAETFSQGECP